MECCIIDISFARCARCRGCIEALLRRVLSHYSTIGICEGKSVWCLGRRYVSKFCYPLGGKDLAEHFNLEKRELTMMEHLLHIRADKDSILPVNSHLRAYFPSGLCQTLKKSNKHKRKESYVPT